MVGEWIIPRTRSGKTIRRSVRDMLEHAVEGRFYSDVEIPSTIEDIGAIDSARAKVKEYFTSSVKEHREAGPVDKAKL